MPIVDRISITLKKKLLDWVIDGGERAVFEKLFLDRPEWLCSEMM